MSETMKAAILYGPKDIRVEDVPIPEISDNDVLIKVAYSGICGSDLPRSQNENGARFYPIIIGHEFSGVVADVGAKVTNFKKGDRVTVAPLIPDPDSPYTKEGNYGLSDKYNIIGTGSHGANAEYVKAPENHVLHLPDEIDMITAAGLEPAAIAYHAFDISNMRPGDTVAVLGAGSVGQFAIQIAKLYGASKIIAVDIFDDKLKLAKELGADVVINSKHEDLYERISQETEEGLGVNLVIEAAGSPITQEQSFNITRKKGEIIWVGTANNPITIPTKTVDKILRGELTLKGSWNSYTAPYPGRAWSHTLDAMSKGQIVVKPMVSDLIKFEELNKYLTDMFEKTIPFNKVMLEVDSSL